MVAASAQTLVLQAGSLSLVIENEGNGWARCYLLGDERIYLGADDFTIVVTRLHEALNRDTAFDGTAAGEIEGLPVVWRLSLFEAHHALYVADDGTDRVLFWQNAHGPALFIAGVMRLTPSQQQQWVQMLAKALKQTEALTLTAV